MRIDNNTISPLRREIDIHFILSHISIPHIPNMADVNDRRAKELAAKDGMFVVHVPTVLPPSDTSQQELWWYGFDRRSANVPGPHTCNVRTTLLMWSHY